MQILKSATYSVHTHTQAQEIVPVQMSLTVSNYHDIFKCQ